MPKRKLTAEREAELRAEYEAWNWRDPDAISADELAARYGLSRNGMYAGYVRKWKGKGVEGDRQRPPASAGGLEPTVRWLVEELARARVRIAELAAREGPTGP